MYDINQPASKRLSFLCLKINFWFP